LPNVLLTTVCRPFGGKGEGDSVGAELFHAQVTRSQGIFSYRQVIRCWGLDYIAENIDAPSVVLHYPSEREFLCEIQKRHYDYIGINFDGLVKSQKSPFRSWFDTSPRTENQIVTVHPIRSP
jgi:hypothetical protein